MHEKNILQQTGSNPLPFTSTQLPDRHAISATTAHLDGVESGEPLGQVSQVFEALEGGRGAAGLEDEPTLRHEHGALAQHVGIQLEPLYCGKRTVGYR